VLPGIADIHGDGFERQMMPRPGVEFSPDLALIDTDRQVIANGITTVFHSVTYSWEPGLRNATNARNMLAAIETLRFQLAADTRFHLRYEIFNLAAEPEVCDWLDRRRVDALAFNDHLPPADSLPSNFSQMLERSGLNRDDFLMLVARLRCRSDEVPRSIVRIAERAKASGVPLISHDDGSPAQRRWFRSLGARVSEFPMNIETAQEAALAGDQIVLGAPNVVRGKSHLGWIDASEMVSRGLCSILASDYYYPSPLAAAFRLHESGVAPLAKAWALICEAPARAMKLDDRGRIEPGLRADLILIDTAVPSRPRVVAVLAAGRIVYLTEPDRILH
jgi:alpha-D-ribose 1-methylphosphonate 5-triphosphate diphosphatase